MGCQGREDNPGPQLGFEAGHEATPPAAQAVVSGARRLILKRASPAVRGAAWSVQHLAGQKKRLLRAEATTIVPEFRADQFIDERRYEVPAIDFSRWLKEMIAQHTKADGSKPFVAVKMDIEGAEYAVLEELVRDATITLISDLMVEFHTQQFDQNQRPHYARRKADIRDDLSHLSVQILSWG